MGDKLVQFEMTAPMALKILREVAKDSERVFPTDHCEKQLAKRKISRTQVLRCLLRGNIVEGPSLSLKGNWEMAVETMTAGNAIRVACALDKDEKGDFIIVITAYYV